MSQFSFEYPWVLGFIVLFVACAYFCKVKNRTIYFPHLSELLLGKKGVNPLMLVLKWLGIVFALVALASPILTKEYSSSKKHGRDIVLIIDSSASMVQDGFDAKYPEKNKFTVVKEVAADFVSKRENDRIGLVNFADVAFVASPLTFDKRFLRKIIEMQRLGMAGQATGINDAIVQAYLLLEESTVESKVIILLTDGKNNRGKITEREVKNLIAKMKTKFYAIGIGKTRDFDGAYLKRLAKAGGGVSYSAQNLKMLEKIYDEINSLEVSAIVDKTIEKEFYLFMYPLLLSILSLVFFIFFRTIRSL